MKKFLLAVCVFTMLGSVNVFAQDCNITKIIGGNNNTVSSVLGNLNNKSVNVSGNTNCNNILGNLLNSGNNNNTNNILNSLCNNKNTQVSNSTLQNLLNQLGVNANITQKDCNTKATTTKVTEATTEITTSKATEVTTKKGATETTTKKATETTTKKVTETTTKKITEATTEATTANTNSNYANQVLAIVNKERAARGLSSLTLDSSAGNVAQIKAEDMAANNYFSHTSPKYGSPFNMLKQFGVSYNTAGENIAKGQTSPTAVMNAWMNSEGHKANILNGNYKKLGVGYTVKNGVTYWVQIFIG